MILSPVSSKAQNHPNLQYSVRIRHNMSEVGKNKTWRRREWRLPLKGNPPFMNRSRGLRTNSFCSRHQSQERFSRKLNLRVSPNKKHTSTEKENDIFVEFKRKHDLVWDTHWKTTHLWRLFPFRIKFFFRLNKEIFY